MSDFLTFQVAHGFGNGLLVGGDAQVAFDYDDTYDFACGTGPTLSGYTVGNVYKLTLRAEIDNLFDETHASRATYGQEFVGEIVPLNESDRSIRLSAEIVF